MGRISVWGKSCRLAGYQVVQEIIQIKVLTYEKQYSIIGTEQ